MIDDLIRRWGMPLYVRDGKLMVDLGASSGLCLFWLPVVVGRGVLACVQFDDADPPTIEDTARPDTWWTMFAAADWPLTSRDLAGLNAAGVTHIDSGAVSLPGPGTYPWVLEPGKRRRLPSRSAVAGAVRVMSLRATG